MASMRDVRETVVRRVKETYNAKKWPTSEEYTYSNLSDSPSSIRLLVIKPGNSTHVLECSLHNYDLEDCPKYAALSYSWDKDLSLKRLHWRFLPDQISNATEEITSQDQSEDQGNVSKKATSGNDPHRTILCNGKVFNVYPSLYDALLRLRQRDPQRYWIDSICINQRDTKEKTHQVSMMGRIYSSAELVIVWLGTAPDGMNAGFSRLDSFLDRALSVAGTELVSARGVLRSVAKDVLHVLFKKEVLIGNALFMLISRRYFRRIWVLQELALSQEVTIILGDNELSPNTLLKAAEFTRRTDLKVYSLASMWSLQMKQYCPQFYAAIQTIPLPAPNRRPDGHPVMGTWSLHAWLKAVMGRKTTNQKDMVFAGLSLIRPEFLRINQDLQLPPALPPRPSTSASSQCNIETAGPMETTTELWDNLHVDYNASEFQVFLNLAACVLSGPNGIILLSIACQYHPQVPNQFSIGYDPSVRPSWMPGPVLGSAPPYTYKSLADLGKGFSAATELANDPRISSGGTTLFIDGAKLGSVEEIVFNPRPFGDINYVSNHASCDTEAMLAFVRTICNLPCTYSVTKRSTLTTIANINTWGNLRDDDSQLQDLTRAFCAQIHNLVEQSLFFKDDTSGFKKRRSLRLEMFELPEKAGERDDEQGEPEETLEGVKQKLREAYRMLKALYPDAPWPQGTELMLTRTEEQHLADSYQTTCSSHLTSNPPVQRRFFTTNSGYMGLAWSAVYPGDEIILIKGASIPYIFRRADTALAMEITALLRGGLVMDTRWRQGSKCKLEPQEKIKTLEGQIGKRDGWVLVGEAYIEGIMDGEAVAEYADRFERLQIV